MSEASSWLRFRRSRPTWFWVYAVVAVVILLALMYVMADRNTRPTTSFEPATTQTAGGEPANDFLPEDRAISDCISAVPKPGCGSEARGGWRQGLVLLAIVVGLALIAWRIVVSARRARSEPVRTP